MTPFLFSCPQCSAKVKCGNPNMVGKKVKCPKCTAVIQVPRPAAKTPAPDTGVKSAPARPDPAPSGIKGDAKPASPAPRAKKTTLAPRVDLENDAPPPLTGGRPRADEHEPPPLKKRRPREEDELPIQGSRSRKDDVDDDGPPRKRSRRDRDGDEEDDRRPSRRGRSKSQAGSSSLMLWLCIGGGVFLIGGAVLLIVLLSGGGSRSNDALVGHWALASKDIPGLAMHMEFKKDGTMVTSVMGMGSPGKYKVVRQQGQKLSVEMSDQMQPEGGMVDIQVINKDHLEFNEPLTQKSFTMRRAAPGQGPVVQLPDLKLPPDLKNLFPDGKFPDIKFPDQKFPDFNQGQIKPTLAIPPARQSLQPTKAGAQIADQLTMQDAVDPFRPGSVAKIYSVRLEANKGYLIDLTSMAFDTYLRLVNSSDLQIRFDDDSGQDLNARLRFRPSQTGDFRIIATSFAPSSFGPFNLVVREE